MLLLLPQILGLRQLLTLMQDSEADILAHDQLLLEIIRSSEITHGKNIVC
jgi:hypothetical protein